MELKAQEDIDAPAEQVFAGLSDFDALVTQALRRGVSVARKDDLTQKGAGMTWEAAFPMRGKTRTVKITVTRFQPSDVLAFHSVSGGLEVATTVELVRLSPSQTRILWSSILDPKTLSARLLVQSMKLTKGGIERRFQRRMKGFAGEFQDRLKRGA